MKKILILIFLSISCSIAQACNTSTADELRKFWDGFREASLHQTPSEISKFYNFPLKILGPYDDDKPIVISRKLFLEQYEVVFRKNIDDDSEKAELLTALEKTVGHDVVRDISQSFNTDGCLKPLNIARIGSYNFTWKVGKGWAIDSVYYVDDFRELTDLFKSLHKK